MQSKTFENANTGSGIEWDGVKASFWMYLEKSGATVVLSFDTTELELAANYEETGDSYQCTEEDIKAAKAEIESSHAPERAKKKLQLAIDWCTCKPETHRRNPADTVVLSTHHGIFEFLELLTPNDRYYIVALDNKGIERGFVDLKTNGILSDNRGGIFSLEAYDTMLLLFGVDQNDLEGL